MGSRYCRRFRGLPIPATMIRKLFVAEYIGYENAALPRPQPQNIQRAADSKSSTVLEQLAICSRLHGFRVVNDFHESNVTRTCTTVTVMCMGIQPDEPIGN